MGCVLIVAGVIGKLFAGYAPWWFKGDKSVIGVGMIPRGEVGLIFAQMGLTTGVFNQGLFTSTTLMVIVTTFLAPPLLKSRLSARPARRTTEPPRGLKTWSRKPEQYSVVDSHAGPGEHASVYRMGPVQVSLFLF